MALKNRTEAEAVVTSWAATLDLEATHKPDLRDEILDNIVFRKDVAASQSAVDATPSVDFTDIDYISLDVTTPPLGSFTITLSGVQQGEIKFLKVIKDANDTILFAGTTINTTLNDVTMLTKTEVLYRITNKDGVSLVIEPLIDEGIEFTGWQTPSYNASFSADSDPLQYRLSYSKLEFRGGMLSSIAAGTAFTLPSNYRPATTVYSNYVFIGAAQTKQSSIKIDSSGNVTNVDASGWALSGSSESNSFNNVIILD